MNSQPKTSSQESTWRRGWMPVKRAVDTYLRYEELFGKKHAELARHAAFPLILTPELVNLIHLNFLVDKNIPSIAEQDFLLSPLCISLGGGVYQIDPVMREVLLVDLIRNVPLGSERIRQLADFLLAYVQHRPWFADESTRRVYEWTAWSILDPQRVVNDMTELLLSPSVMEESDQTRKRADQLQISMMLDILQAPLTRRITDTSLTNLVETAQVIGQYWHEEQDSLDPTSNDEHNINEAQPRNPLLASVLRDLSFTKKTQTKISTPQLSTPIKPLYGTGPVAMKDKLWTPGMVLRVAFLDGPEELHHRIMQIAQQWSNYVNLAFELTQSRDAEIRVSFDSKTGSWSYIGRDALNTSIKNKPTMNFGWLTINSSQEQIESSVFGNFSLVIGIVKSHMNPIANIPWNEEAVIKELSGPPNNWTKETIKRNVFDKLVVTQSIYAPIDPETFWQPYLRPNWVTDTVPTKQTKGFSKGDIEFLAKLYPPGHYVKSTEGVPAIEKSVNTTEEAAPPTSPITGTSKEDRTLPLIRLGNRFAILLPDVSLSRLIVVEAQLNPASIQFDNLALNNWHNILDEANKRDKVESLVLSAIDHFGPDPEVISAYQAYMSSIGKTERLFASTPQPDTRTTTNQSMTSKQPIVQRFTQGHALLIGVGTYQHISYANVPITVADAEAVATILRDECGYPAHQVTLLHDNQATRQGILSALQRLATRTQPESTLFLYYAGHGQYGTDGKYYLTTHDSKLDGNRVVAGSGISDSELIDKLRAIPARRLLVIFNACHSGSISPNLSLDPAAEVFESLAPPENTMDAILSTGEGRIIMTACRPDQKSWIGSGKLTLFTQALVEGLRGEGYVPNNGGYIGAYGLYEHLYDSVKERAEEIGKRQEPELTVLRGVGPFPVALYKGATSLGDFDDQTPVRKDTAAREVKPERSQRMLQTFIVQNTNVVAKERGVAIGGNVTGSTISTGDNNRTDQSSRVVDQRGQKVQGNQTNFTGNVNTGGGLFNSGNINTSGDFVGRDSNVYGDVVHGDKVGGDKTTTGNVSGTGVAIGRGAQANVNQGLAGNQLAQLFAPMLAIAQSAPADKRDEAIKTAEAMQQEAAKGKQEDDSVLAELVENLVGLVPSAVSAVVSAFASPILAGVVGPATKYVLRQLGVK